MYLSSFMGCQVLMQMKLKVMKSVQNQRCSFLYCDPGAPHMWSPLITIKKDRKSTRLNSSHQIISYAVFCLKKKRQNILQAAHHAKDNKKLTASKGQGTCS